MTSLELEHIFFRLKRVHNFKILKTLQIKKALISKVY